MSHYLRSVLAAASGLVLIGAGCLVSAQPSGAATPGHATRVVAADFPDPGFAKFGSTYHLYKTGGLYGHTSSAAPQSGYGSVASSMTKVPAWVDASDTKLWAPDVFAAQDTAGKTRYVMYFTGQSADYHVHCIGVATSYSPGSGFVPGARPVVCSPQRTDGYEAIDPSAYHAKDGKRYMLYKSDKGNTTGFQIRAIEMDTQTGTAVAGNSFAKITSSTRIEAPTAIAHDGHVWLFTSRGDYTDCSYSTDVWRADTFAGGTFTRVKTVMSTASTGLCGPGGATVITDGTATRVAFHAYPDANGNGVKDNSTRQAWVGELRWDASGEPYLY